MFLDRAAKDYSKTSDPEKLTVDWKKSQKKSDSIINIKHSFVSESVILRNKIAECISTRRQSIVCSTGTNLDYDFVSEVLFIFLDSEH